MRHRLPLLSLLAGVALATLAGCTSVRISKFASEESVDTLRADHDAAIAQVRADEQAARDAFAAEWRAAIAAGKTTDEALGQAIAAESAKAQGAATAAAQVAIDARGKAEAAKQGADGSTSPLGTVLAGVGGTLLSVILGYLGLRKYDAAPFKGPDGTAVPESALVAAALSALSRPGVTRPAAPPTSAAAPSV